MFFVDGHARVERAGLDDPGTGAAAFAQGSYHAALGQALQVAAGRSRSGEPEADIAEGEHAIGKLGARQAADDQVAAVLTGGDRQVVAALDLLQILGPDERDRAGVRPPPEPLLRGVAVAYQSGLFGCRFGYGHNGSAGLGRQENGFQCGLLFVGGTGPETHGDGLPIR